MGWIKDRIDAEYKKHKDLDWSRIAEIKILANIKYKADLNELIDKEKSNQFIHELFEEEKKLEEASE